MRGLRSLAFVALALLSVGLVSPGAPAAVPQTMNYQVMLTDDSDQPLVDQSVELVFTLWTQESGGTQEWTETHNTMTNSIGVVSVILGSVTPLDPDDFSASLWLEVKVDGQVVFADGKPTRVDGEEIRAKAREQAKRLHARL